MPPEDRPGLESLSGDVFHHYTICVLCFDDYVDLARRCLTSVRPLWERGAELRIAANAPSAALRQYLQDFVQECPSIAGPVMFQLHDDNRGKYPAMRDLFQAAPLRPLVMWFDDDSYLHPEVSRQPRPWLEDVSFHMHTNAMVGAILYWRLLPGQPSWIMQQSWWRPAHPRRAGQTVRFIVGGWWVLRGEVIERYGLPVAGAHHRGGDVMMGQLLCCQELPFANYTAGVAINADQDGVNHRAPRRGLSNSDPYLGRSG